MVEGTFEDLSFHCPCASITGMHFHAWLCDMGHWIYGLVRTGQVFQQLMCLRRLLSSSHAKETCKLFPTPRQHIFFISYSLALYYYFSPCSGHQMPDETFGGVEFISVHGLSQLSPLWQNRCDGLQLCATCLLAAQWKEDQDRKWYHTLRHRTHA